ncbi:hypothetical protein BH09ACT1_BH09ACT1_10700 [soil metagenome]
MTGETGFTGDSEHAAPSTAPVIPPVAEPVPFGTDSGTPRRPSPLVTRLGLTSLVVAVVGIAAEVVGIIIGNAGEWQGATILAWAAIVLTALAFFGGLVAAIANRDRRLGVIALLAGLVGNPLVLVGLLAALGG